MSETNFKDTLLARKDDLMKDIITRINVLNIFSCAHLKEEKVFNMKLKELKDVVKTINSLYDVNIIFELTNEIDTILFKMRLEDTDTSDDDEYDAAESYNEAKAKLDKLIELCDEYKLLCEYYEKYLRLKDKM